MKHFVNICLARIFSYFMKIILHVNEHLLPQFIDKNSSYSKTSPETIKLPPADLFINKSI